MPLITISCLGNKGRAGNAMFQYVFAKAYAGVMGCDLQTPDWWGRKVFPEATSDPLIDKELPKTHCDSVCKQLGLKLGYFVGQKDIDLRGYFQHANFLDFYSVQKARKWLRINPHLDSFPVPPLPVAHYRRGDYATDPTFKKLYCTISDASYEKAFHQHGYKSVTKIYEGWRSPPQDIIDAGVPWLGDFLAIRDAPVRFRSNSTFAWWACTLGGGRVFSPVVCDKVGLQDVEFVEGNWPNCAGIFPNQSDLFLNDT